MILTEALGYLQSGERPLKIFNRLLAGMERC